MERVRVSRATTSVWDVDGPLDRVAAVEEIFGGRGASLGSRASIGVVAAINGHRSGRGFTQTLIERVAAGERYAALHTQVAVWRPAASREQVEEAVQEACLRAERACHGQTEDEVFVWLRTTARRELGRIDERARREVLMDAAQLALHAGLDTADAPEQELIDREDDAEIGRASCRERV